MTSSLLTPPPSRTTSSTSVSALLKEPSTDHPTLSTPCTTTSTHMDREPPIHSTSTCPSSWVVNEEDAKIKEPRTPLSSSSSLVTSPAPFGSTFNSNEKNTLKKEKVEEANEDPSVYTLMYGYKKFPVDWPQMLFLVITPWVALMGLMYVQLTWATWVWSVVYYFISGTGITAGYHRLWAHRAYSASTGFRLWMMLAGSAAVQGSIRWWSRHHRAHHRYTDTSRDPYSAHKGLFWSHLGWMFFKQPNPSLKNVDVSDLDGDALVQWQHRYYVWMALMMAFVVPGLVGCLWGDGWGALMYAGLVRLVVVHHATFCVNSLAHYLGDRPYDDRRTPRNHLVTAFITLGEGYHNFHHEFPNDYRNAIKFYQYDPTKWLIQLAFRLGLVWDLKRAPDDVIEKGQINMLQKNLDLRKSNLTWGKADHELPIWNEDEFNEERLLNPFLLRLHGYVYDVSLFIHQHPGGPRVMKPYLGKDATQAFEGQVYLHSTAARHIARTLRIAKMNLR